MLEIPSSTFFLELNSYEDTYLRTSARGGSLIYFWGPSIFLLPESVSFDQYVKLEYWAVRQKKSRTKNIIFSPRKFTLKIFREIFFQHFEILSKENIFSFEKCRFLKFFGSKILKFQKIFFFDFQNLRKIYYRYLGQKCKFWKSSNFGVL